MPVSPSERLPSVLERNMHLALRSVPGMELISTENGQSLGQASCESSRGPFAPPRDSPHSHQIATPNATVLRRVDRVEVLRASLVACSPTIVFLETSGCRILATPCVKAIAAYIFGAESVGDFGSVNLFAAPRRYVLVFRFVVWAHSRGAAHPALRPIFVFPEAPLFCIAAAF